MNEELTLALQNSGMGPKIHAIAKRFNMTVSEVLQFAIREKVFEKPITEEITAQDVDRLNRI